MITDQQVTLLRYNMVKYSHQKIAAAKSGMSEGSARKYLKTSRLPSEMKSARHWRTHPDVFASVWEEVTRMLTLSPSLTAKTILSHLRSSHPGHFKPSHLRTLQRQIQIWKSTQGPDKEVIFPQEIHPGRQSQSDYTHMESLGVTISGQPFPHLLYHFMLPYSRWESASLCFTESFESLTMGYEDAVWKLGKQAPVHRTDNQSAVSKIFGQKRGFTDRWQEFMKHYGVSPSCNNPGKGHENGSVEKSHDLLKKAIDQELLIRGTRNFESQKAYMAFVDRIIEGRNKERQERLAEELDLLHALPSCKYHAPVLTLVRVGRASTVRIQGGVYSTPSRLIGCQLKACIYPLFIELYYGTRLVQKMPKLRQGQEHAINYRHIIKQLIRKPGAFEDYQYKECLFPRVIFRQAYDAYRKAFPQGGSKMYLKVLHLAALHGESLVADFLEEGFKSGSCPSFEEIVSQLSGTKKVYPEVGLTPPRLKLYDPLVKTLCPGELS